MSSRLRLPTVSGMTENASRADRLHGVGEMFVAALAARDFPRIRETIRADVRFRLLVPRGPQENSGTEETLARFVGWFAGVDELHLESSYVNTVADRLVMTYRLRLRDASGWRLIEQHLVATAASDGRLDSLDLLCTGFHRCSAPAVAAELPVANAASLADRPIADLPVAAGAAT